MSVDFILIPSQKLDAKKPSSGNQVSNFRAKAVKCVGRTEAGRAIGTLLQTHLERNSGELDPDWLEGVISELLQSSVEAAASLNPILAPFFNDGDSNIIVRNLRDRLHRVLLSGIAEATNLVP
jgi:hypothetical protein